jgi:hypothetical protein
MKIERQLSRKVDIYRHTLSNLITETHKTIFRVMCAPPVVQRFRHSAWPDKSNCRETILQSLSRYDTHTGLDSLRMFKEMRVDQRAKKKQEPEHA